MLITHFIADPISAHSIPPIPAKNLIPQWYKDGEQTFTHNGKEQTGMKGCIPILDVLLCGYYLRTSVDLYVKKDNDGKIAIEFGEGYSEGMLAPIEERPDELGKTIPRPAGHLRNHLLWTSSWAWKTPRGYSILITHPFNGWDLPFTTMSAIVDSDKFHGPGNTPFFLKENFEGLIPRGTPYAQILPFKRKNWKSVYNQKLTEYALKNGGENRNGMYKTETWQKKIYLMEEIK